LVGIVGLPNFSLVTDGHVSIGYPKVSVSDVNMTIKSALVTEYPTNLIFIDLKQSTLLKCSCHSRRGLKNEVVSFMKYLMGRTLLRMLSNSKVQNSNTSTSNFSIEKKFCKLQPQLEQHIT
jgi:hypothetical protein